MSDTSNGYGTMSDSFGRETRISTVAVNRSPSRDSDQQLSTPDEAAVSAPRTDDSFYAGIILLLLVVLLWTFSNFLTNYQLTQGYDKPFAVTYLNTSSFALYLIPFAWALQRRPKHSRMTSVKFDRIFVKMGFTIPAGSIWSSENHLSAPEGAGYAALPSYIDDDWEDSAQGPRRSGRLLTIGEEQRRLMRPSSIDGRRPLSQVANPATQIEAPLDMHQTAVLAAQFMLIWFMANYCLNVSLKLTSVASATTLSSASGFFTLALGSIVGVEMFSLAKLAAVTMSFVGVLMVTRADASPPKPGDGNLGSEPALPFAGDLLALGSALFYALYVILLKHRIGREERVSMPLFFGFVGLLNIVVMWPIGVVLHLTNAETVEWPQGSVMWAGVVVNMMITVVSDFAYLLAMLKSSPLVATVGLSLTIPLAILGDTLRNAHSGGVQAYLGSAIVLLSFVAIGLVDRMLAQRMHHVDVHAE